MVLAVHLRYLFKNLLKQWKFPGFTIEGGKKKKKRI